MRIGKLFLYFSSKTYVGGIEKNRLDETFFEHPKHMFKLMGKEKKYANKMSLAGSMFKIKIKEFSLFILHLLATKELN